MSDSTEDIVEVEGYAEVTIEGREEALKEADQKIREVAEILRVVKKDSTAYARAFLDAEAAPGPVRSLGRPMRTPILEDSPPTAELGALNFEATGPAVALCFRGLPARDRAVLGAGCADKRRRLAATRAFPLPAANRATGWGRYGSRHLWSGHQARPLLPLRPRVLWLRE